METALSQAEKPWMKVNGPMSAAYMHLREMGWTIDIRPEEERILYTDTKGDSYEIMDGVSWHEFRETLEQEGLAQLWPAMARQRGGAGLEKGADLTAGRKHYRWLVKKGRMREAGALMSIMSGALWPPKRLIENKIIDEDGTAAYCPICGEHGVDEGHLFWECPGIQSGSHPIIPKTNRYCREYCSNNTEENRCWY